MAKCDVTENEIEGLNIKSYPTLKFYPANKKDKAPIDFDGDRNSDGILKFLKEKTTHDWVETDDGTEKDKAKEQDL